jgi:asparagine synthase (glutamine-hydrolysing)
MCGLAGFYTPAGLKGTGAVTLREMTEVICHRGPDDAGAWLDGEAGVALGHRRLSIIDVSPLGHQPMESPAGRYVAVYNGEIYNFHEIRAQLSDAGASLRGSSDTEVLLAAFEQFGMLETLRMTSGMFALAVWDRRDRALHLIRDRVGEKPLYYGWFDGTLLFGSELKALRAHPAWKGEIDRNALALYLRHSYVPAPYSIYAGVMKAQPGTITTFRAAQPGEAGTVQEFWSARDAVHAAIANPLEGSEAEIIEQCDASLRRTISQEMVSDVPLGAFLSGGIDSSLVVALMQAQSATPIRTFTIGFHEQEYNEANHAKAVAQHLGTDHTEAFVTAKDMLDVIPRLPAIYDEPFADASQVPTFLVAQLARRHVTVSLSGDGGDELFGGYNRYAWVPRIWPKLRFLPAAVRRTVAGAVTSVSPQGWDRMYGSVSAALPRSMRLKLPGDRVHKLAGILGSPSEHDLYHRLTSNWNDPSAVALGSTEPATALTTPARWLRSDNFVEQMMYLDTVSYLPDDIMVKVDRASMAVSLESRAPFLDHRILELAWRVPMSMKVRDGKGKWVLRQILDRYVPRALIERPKMGFGVPIDLWLRGPLREWAEALLAPDRLQREGFFDVDVIRRKWTEHLSGARNWQYPLWSILVFQAWLESQSAARPG